MSWIARDGYKKGYDCGHERGSSAKKNGLPKQVPLPLPNYLDCDVAAIKTEMHGGRKYNVFPEWNSSFELGLVDGWNDGWASVSLPDPNNQQIPGPGQQYFDPSKFPQEPDVINLPHKHPAQIPSGSGPKYIDPSAWGGSSQNQIPGASQPGQLPAPSASASTSPAAPSSPSAPAAPSTLPPDARPQRPPPPTETFPERDVSPDPTSDSLPIIIGATILVGIGAFLLSG